MPGKIVRGPLIGFVFRFVCIFGILIASWPGWNDCYGHYFRGASQAALNFGETKRMVRLTPNQGQSIHANIDTLMSMGNRDLLDATGKGLVERTGLDSRSIGWLPTALTMALILATPIPWRRRGLALLGGLILVQGFILFSLLSWVWDNSSDLSLMTLSPLGKEVFDELSYALINQLGASFSVPVLIWILVTFRSQDAGGANRPKREQRRSEAKPQTAGGGLLSGGGSLSTAKKDEHHSQGDDRRKVLSLGLGSSQGAGVVGVRNRDFGCSIEAVGEAEVGGYGGRGRRCIRQVHAVVARSLPRVQHVGIRLIDNCLVWRIGSKRDATG